MAKKNNTEIAPIEEAQNNPIQTILRNMGQPTKYTPEACLKIVEIAAQGGHTAAMILAAGARSRATYYDWQEKYPEFKDAVELAKLVSQAYYEDPEVIKSMPTTSWAIIMNNKFSDDYSRTGATGTTNNINFNTLNLNEAQKMDRIKGLLVKLNSAGRQMGEIYDGQSYDESDDE